jgi:Flp pilus assembly protein protease CpaA
VDWLIFFIVVVWLLIISWFDLRTGEIPHSLWVILPLIAAEAFRAWQGQWQLVLLSTLVSLVSERQRISLWFHLEEASRMITWLPLLMLTTFWGAQVEPIPAFAILAFWIAWELGWWGGADAVSAIALTLVWPHYAFFIAFFGCNAIVALGLMAFTYKQEKKVKTHRLPGLPIMLLAVLCTQVIQRL